MEIHKPWLNTAFSVSSSDKSFSFNGIPHSTFSVNFCFQNESNSYDTSIINSKFSEWKEDIPIIIVHNMFGLTTNIQEILKESFTLMKNNCKSDIPPIIASMKLQINRFLDVLRQYVYADFLVEENTELIFDVLGNKCAISLQNVIELTLNNLINTLYKDKNINCNYIVFQKLKNIDASSGFYSFIVGFLSLIIERIPEGDTLEITIEGGLNDNQIQIKNEQCDFISLFSTDNKPFYIKNRISMYKRMLKAWGGGMICSHNSVKLLI